MVGMFSPIGNDGTLESFVGETQAARSPGDSPFVRRVLTALDVHVLRPPPILDILP